MEETRTYANLADKLVEAMAIMGALRCNAQTSFGPKFDYVTEDQITCTVRSAFTEVGLAIVPTSCGIIESIPLDKGFNVRVMQGFRIMDRVSGEYMDMQMIGEAADASDKAVTKALTSCWKSLLTQLCMLYTDDGSIQPAKAPIKCVQCSKPIVDAKLGQTNYTAADLQKLSQEKYGKPMCSKCIASANSAGGGK